MANPTADWEQVGDRFYRRIQLYTAVFDQDLELENYVVAGAPYGGAIGMLSRTFLVSLRSGLNRFPCSQSVLQVFCLQASSGKIIQSLVGF